MVLPAALRRTVQDTFNNDFDSPIFLLFDTPLGLIMDRRDAPRSRTVLAAQGLRWTEEPLGAYVLLVVEPAAPDQDAARYPTVFWNDAGCFAATIQVTFKKKAQWLVKQAATNRTDRAIALMQEALTLYPNHQLGRARLATTLTASGNTLEAARQQSVLRDQTVPSIPAPIRFPNGGISGRNAIHPRGFPNGKLSTSRISGYAQPR